MSHIEKKILIVDDEENNSFSLRAVLHAKGYNCLIAKNGMEAVQKVKSDEGIKVVLMDIMMPVMDGYQTIAEIKGIHEFKYLPIIAVTARALPADVKKCMDAGVDYHLPKPIIIDDLLKLVRLYL
jgi:CheY-like chemotaxis protein